MVKSKSKGLNEKGKGTITCGNIWEVSFLIYNKIPFLRTEMQNGKVVFIFPASPEVQKAMQKFILNSEVRLEEYIGTFQRVKNMIYQEKGKSGYEKKTRENKRRFYPRAICDDRE
jgi:hypothetical protein